MDGQDWEPVKVGRRGAPKAAGLAAQADRAGRVKAEVKQRVAGASAAAALERKAEDGVLRTKKVSRESVRELIQARLALKFTQDQADVHCALPKHTMKGIEAGTLVPGGDVLSKISRGLHVNLKME